MAVAETKLDLKKVCEWSVRIGLGLNITPEHSLQALSEGNESVSIDVVYCLFQERLGRHFDNRGTPCIYINKVYVNIIENITI